MKQYTDQKDTQWTLFTDQERISIAAQRKAVLDYLNNPTTQKPRKWNRLDMEAIVEIVLWACPPPDGLYQDLTDKQIGKVEKALRKYYGDSQLTFRQFFSLRLDGGPTPTAHDIRLRIRHQEHCRKAGKMVIVSEDRQVRQDMTLINKGNVGNTLINSPLKQNNTLDNSAGIHDTLPLVEGKYNELSALVDVVLKARHTYDVSLLALEKFQKGE